MCPSRKINDSVFHHRQTGISLVMLLFIIIIVSLLAAGLVNLNSQSQISLSHHILSQQAFSAAESGANIQAMQLFPVDGSPGNCSNQNFIFNTQGLKNCQAITSCSATTINSHTFYTIVSQGQCAVNSPMQATRTIEVRFKSIN
ncbi:MAG: pilus assembly PilX N-terminal domain-containing protein [Gammaproteobacteria bacterium]|nr:pilus assembly PilX N-terminal domain-containing protein [Gammaproteobacteria bacterium]MDH5628966.1 pilus assembly PilX N-terminal domain-containing protein [Gammaproteobacteria bacterium]